MCHVKTEGKSPLEVEKLAHLTILERAEVCTGNSGKGQGIEKKKKGIRDTKAPVCGQREKQEKKRR